MQQVTILYKYAMQKKSKLPFCFLSALWEAIVLLGVPINQLCISRAAWSIEKHLHHWWWGTELHLFPSDFWRLKTGGNLTPHDTFFEDSQAFPKECLLFECAKLASWVLALGGVPQLQWYKKNMTKNSKKKHHDSWRGVCISIIFH